MMDNFMPFVMGTMAKTSKTIHKAITGLRPTGGSGTTTLSGRHRRRHRYYRQPRRRRRPASTHRPGFIFVRAYFLDQTVASKSKRSNFIFAPRLRLMPRYVIQNGHRFWSGYFFSSKKIGPLSFWWLPPWASLEDLPISQNSKVSGLFREKRMWYKMISNLRKVKVEHFWSSVEFVEVK